MHALGRTTSRRSVSNLALTITLCAAAIFPHATPYAQQTALAGTVLVDGNETPLANAEITFPRLNKSARTDSAGKFAITGLPAGAQAVTVRLIGYLPVQQDITLGEGKTHRVKFLLNPSVPELPNVDVTASNISNTWAIKLAEFEERRKMGTGRFLTAGFFEANSGRPPSSFLAEKLPGIKFVQAYGHRYLASTRGCGTNCIGMDVREKVPSACYMQIVINGIVRYDGEQEMFDFDLLNAQDILGLEFYTVANTPLQYNRTKSPKSRSCGTVIVWTKGG